MRTWAVGLAMLVAAPALAQESGGLGLDLTGDQQTEQPEQKPDPNSADQESPPPAATTTAADTKPAASADAPTKPESGLLGERDITQDDRVKSVQKKVYLKVRRFEVTPMITATVNDPFFLKWGGVLRVAYYLGETLAVVARGSLLQTLKTDDVRLGSRTFTALILPSEPRWSAMGDLEWSPIYGKVAFLNNILHFDAYLVGGLGTVYSATSEIPGRGPNFAADVGGGLRFVIKDYLAVNVALINTAYVDSGPYGTTKGITQNMLSVNAGISVFFPFTSTGKEAE